MILQVIRCLQVAVTNVEKRLFEHLSHHFSISDNETERVTPRYSLLFPTDTGLASICLLFQRVPARCRHCATHGLTLQRSTYKGARGQPDTDLQAIRLVLVTLGAAVSFNISG